MSNYNCDHERFDGAIQFDQLDDAIIGYGNQFNNPVVIYDYSKCLEIFETDFKESCDLHADECREACDHYLEAIEWMDHNVTGAWVGPGTPIFLHHSCDASPCARCGDEISETLNHDGRYLCETCHNVEKCGCEVCIAEAGLLVTEI